MTEFTASNGVTVKKYGAGLTLTGDPVDLDRLREKLQAGSYGDITPSMQDALREFFQHERDEELGRWRWPENPEFVVYMRREDGQAVVFNESTGVMVYRYRGEHEHIQEIRRISGEEVMPHTRAARAYFEAHPERKPWEDAKPGEVWELVYAQLGEPTITRPFTVDSFGNFRNTSGVRMGDLDITAGRCVWPEEDAS